MPPKGKTQPSPPRTAISVGPSGKVRDWSHPDGIALEDVEVNGEYDGRVTNVGPFGVFVDFGAVKDGLLRVPTRFARAFKRGMEVKGMVVTSCDPEVGKVVLQLDESMLPEPPPRRTQSASRDGGGGGVARQGGGGGKGSLGGSWDGGGGKGGEGGWGGGKGSGGGYGGSGVGGGGGGEKGGGGGGAGARRSGSASARPRSRPRQRRTWDHEEAIPLEEINEGDVFVGTVTNVSTSGVFVDIGAVRDARLSVSARIGRRFRIGDVVQDCQIERIDLERGRMSAVLPDPEAAVQDLPPKERRAPKAKAKGKAKAKPKAKAQASSEGYYENGDGYYDEYEEEEAEEEEEEEPRPPVRQRSSSGKGGPAAAAVGKGRPTSASPPVRRATAPPAEPAPKPGPKRAAAPTAPAPAAPSAKAGAKARPASAPPKGSAKAKAGPATKDSRRPSGFPVGRFRVGGIANGVVTHVAATGVYVDIGAVTDGVLKLPRALASQFRVGDEVHGMSVEAVDKDEERIILFLEDPELEEPPPPPPKAANSAAPKAKSKAKAQPQTAPQGKGQQAQATSPPPRGRTKGAGN